MNSQAQNLYFRTQVNTANPGELTLMLYNGAIKFIKQAEEDIKNKNYEGKHANIMRAMDIFDEFLITLDHQYDISRNFTALYIFIKEKLTEANLKMDLEPLQVALRLTTEFRDTWAEALKIVKSGSATASSR